MTVYYIMAILEPPNGDHATQDEWNDEPEFLYGIYTDRDLLEAALEAIPAHVHVTTTGEQDANRGYVPH